MSNSSKSQRPRVELSRQSYDYLLEILALAGLVSMLVLAGLNYHQLPERIPTHFGPNGQPDGFGDKTAVWFLPLLGVVMYAFMTYLNRRPDWFNYPVKITPENAAIQYRLGTRLVSGLKAFIMLLFAYLVLGTIRIAGGEWQGLHWWILPIVLVVSLGNIFYFHFKSAANK
jgi:hypothetical protein